MKNLIKQISDMFKDIIGRIKGDGGDLGRIIINHPEFHMHSQFLWINGPTSMQTG